MININHLMNDLLKNVAASGEDFSDKQKYIGG